MKAAEGGLHSLIALGLGAESQLEERLEQDVLKVLSLLPAKGQLDAVEVLLIEETLRLFASLVLVVVGANELAIRITHRRREDHLMGHFDVPLELVELFLLEVVVSSRLSVRHDSLLARGLQHMEVTEDGLAPDAALINRSGHLGFRLVLVRNGKILLVQFLEEVFG